MHPALLLAFDDEQVQALALTAALHTPLARVERHRFPGAESRLRLPPQRPDPLLVLHGLHQPKHKRVESLTALPAARLLGARRILLFSPWLACMRQDRAFTPGAPWARPPAPRWQRVLRAWMCR